MPNTPTGRFILRFGNLMKYTRPKRFGSYTRGEMLILGYLYDTSTPVQPGELCGVMEASSARVAAALRSLEAKGLIIRSVDAEDRRRILVSITDAGRALVEARRVELYDYFHEIITRLGEDDVNEALRILDRITEIVDALEGQSTPGHPGEGGDNLAD